MEQKNCPLIANSPVFLDLSGPASVTAVTEKGAQNMWEERWDVKAFGFGTGFLNPNPRERLNL